MTESSRQGRGIRRKDDWTEIQRGPECGLCFKAVAQTVYLIPFIVSA